MAKKTTTTNSKPAAAAPLAAQPPAKNKSATLAPAKTAVPAPAQAAAPKAKPAAVPASPAVVAQGGPAKPASAKKTGGFTQNDVALRAYLISEKRQAQGIPGDPHQDWIEAERQLQTESKAPVKTKS